MALNSDRRSLLVRVLRILRMFANSLATKVTARRFLVLSVAFPLGVRVIPELLAGPWPLGFDTVGWYAPFINDVETGGFVFGFQGVAHDQVAPVMFVLFGLVATITHAPPFAITKAAAPFLYSFLGFSLYYFARKGLEWDQRKSFLLVLISALYFVPLRFSWDMYKNILGYAFFLLALIHLGASLKLRDKSLLFMLTVLCALASEFTSLLLGATALLLFAWERIKGKRWRRYMPVKLRPLSASRIRRPVTLFVLQRSPLFLKR